MRIGVFGGTFDPIHIGHIVMATLAREELDLDHVIWIPAYRPPHKDEHANHPVSSFEQRLHMVELAIAGRPYFSVSSIEGQYDGPSYTYDTMRRLQSICPDQYVFLCGADSLAAIDTWYRSHDLLREFMLGVFQRQDFQTGEINQKLKQMDYVYENVKWLDTPLFDVSSTWLRKRLRAGLGVADLIPKPVHEYIKEYRLYE